MIRTKTPTLWKVLFGIWFIGIILFADISIFERAVIILLALIFMEVNMIAEKYD